VTEESAVPRPRIGQVAVVTGGSAGLGFAIAGALARAGSAVLLAGRSAKRCQQAADHLTAETGSPVLGQACDVTDEDAVDQLIDRALSAYGRLDVLVTSAGVQARGTHHELSVAELRACLEVRGQQGRRRPAHPQPRGRARGNGHHGQRARAGTVPDAAERRNR
jgi:NADP-dependent 3-hydroxy acid dehydrogenase YdfG